MNSPHILLPCIEPAGTTEIVDSGSTGATFTVVNGGGDIWNTFGQANGSASNNYLWSDDAAVLAIAQSVMDGVLFFSANISHSGAAHTTLFQLGSLSAAGGVWCYILNSERFGITVAPGDGGATLNNQLLSETGSYPTGDSHVALLLDTKNKELRLWFNGVESAYNQTERDDVFEDIATMTEVGNSDIGITFMARNSSVTAGSPIPANPLTGYMKNIFMADLRNVENPWRYAERNAVILSKINHMYNVPQIISEDW